MSIRTVDELESARQILKAFSRAGFELFPLKAGQKVPRDEGWRTRQYTLAADIAAWVKRGGNVGVRLRDVDLVLDIDPRNFEPGDDPVLRLCADMGVDITHAPTTNTGRGDGGRHIFWAKPAGLRIKGKLDAYPGIDFRSESMFVVAPSSVHPDTGGTYRIDTSAPPISAVRPAPDALLALLARQDNQVRVGGEGAGIMTNEQLAKMLAAFDPEEYGMGHYGKWIALAAACHDATGGAGLPAFLDWCAGDDLYANEESEVQVERHWASFKAGKPGGATFRTLLRAVADAGRPDLVARFESEADKAGAFDLDALRAEAALDDWESTNG